VLVEAAAREGFLRWLQQQGVQGAIHYPRLIPAQQALAVVPFEVRGALSRAEEYAACEVSLPIHPHLEDEEVARVVSAINRWTGP
jgi:dTDP-4-amino-4,6-dideoxygalactose transaminase